MCACTSVSVAAMVSHRQLVHMPQHTLCEVGKESIAKSAADVDLSGLSVKPVKLLQCLASGL